jgi:hypothetical protein
VSGRDSLAGLRKRHLGCFSGMQQSGTEGGSAVSLSRASTPACAGLANHNLSLMGEFDVS